MTGTKPKVSIKTMTDYHLEEYKRCPFRFYYRHLIGMKTRHFDWRMMVEHVVHRVIVDFYKCPVEKRSSMKILELIHMHWIKKIDLFESKVHYFYVLAQMTNNLLTYLNEAESTDPPLFLFEKFRTSSEELGIDLAMNIPLAEWTNDSITIRKFTMNARPEDYTWYTYFTVLFFQKAFDLRPEKIQIVHLLTGKKEEYYPQETDVRKAMEYLEEMNAILKDTHSYKRPKSFADCNLCPFKRKCHRDWIPGGEREPASLFYD
jgi:CRISPR/Cas system-associated exonuclease Cas4 (RecB family)